MSKRLFSFLACLLCLIMAYSTLSAQTAKLFEGSEKVIRLYRSDIPGDVDLETYLRSGEVKLQSGLECFPPKVTPGPAPDPYPHVHMWELGIEQLGRTSAKCDGIWFINGNIWHPKKIALMLWKIRVPNPSMRLASEFEQDLTVSLWVDWNQDRAWGKNENMVCENLNIEKFFPNNYSCLEIWYLTWFCIPRATTFTEECGGKWTKYTAKLWARGLLSYDDPDASPDGECLFGEVEDYQISYFEIQKKSTKKDGSD
jgi:hypothetical protein